MLQYGMKEQLMNHSDRTDHFAESDIAVAADLGGTHLRVAAVDSNGKVLDRIKLQTPTGDYAEDIVRAVSESARTLEHRLTNRKSRFRAISVVVPGTVHVESGVVTHMDVHRTRPGSRTGHGFVPNRLNGDGLVGVFVGCEEGARDRR